jgi:hypothetical protein
MNMEQFVQSYEAAWASRDPLAMKPLWHEEGVLHHPILSEPITGKWVPANNHRTKTVVPGFKWSLIRWASADEYLFLEWENGADLGDDRKTWRGVDRMRMAEDRIIEEIVYFDTFPLRAMTNANIEYTPMVDVAELNEFFVGG